MKSKPTRKNQLKKNRDHQRSKFRYRAVFTAKVFFGVLALLTASAAFIFVYDYFTQTPHFQAHRIEVTGQQRLSSRQVMKIAGVGTQTNILALNLTTTRKRLLASPWIADVTVSREIPSGLRFHIREEKPLALLDMGGSECFLINTAGNVFKREDGSGNSALPRVQGLNHSDLPVPDKPATKAFSSMMTLFDLAGSKNSPLSIYNIRRIKMDREIGATVFIGEESRVVRLGFGRYREKIEVLEQVVAKLSRHNRLSRYQVIDLFDVNRIVITPASAGTADSDDEEV